MWTKKSAESWFEILFIHSSSSFNLSRLSSIISIWKQWKWSSKFDLYLIIVLFFSRVCREVCLLRSLFIWGNLKFSQYSANLQGMGQEQKTLCSGIILTLFLLELSPKLKYLQLIVWIFRDGYLSSVRSYGKSTSCWFQGFFLCF